MEEMAPELEKMTITKTKAYRKYRSEQIERFMRILQETGATEPSLWHNFLKKTGPKKTSNSDVIHAFFFFFYSFSKDLCPLYNPQHSFFFFFS